MQTIQGVKMHVQMIGLEAQDDCLHGPPLGNITYVFCLIFWLWRGYELGTSRQSN